MVQRMRELAIQSISDTNTLSDRSALNLEFQALAQEISRIGGNTQWNGGNMLDGQIGVDGTSTFHIGANANQVITATFPTLGAQEGDFVSTGTAGTGGNVAAGSSAAQKSEFQISQTFSTLRTGDTLTYTVNGQAGYGVLAVAGDGAVSLSSSSNVTLADAGAVTLTVSAAGTSAAKDTKILLTAANNNVAFTVDNVQVTRGIGADVAKTDISTFSTATAALNVLDAAVANVNMKRAELGAVANRLEYASDNMSNISMNARASRSRVEDADYASETTELARTQIIQQAGTAMLAQANQSQQSVLKLLQ